MSEKGENDVSQVDILTATEIRNLSISEGSPKSDRTSSPGLSTRFLLCHCFSTVKSDLRHTFLYKDLSKVLPKLQKRINASNNNSNNNSQYESPPTKNGGIELTSASQDAEKPLDFDDVVLEKIATETPVRILQAKTNPVTMYASRPKIRLTFLRNPLPSLCSPQHILISRIIAGRRGQAAPHRAPAPAAARLCHARPQLHLLHQRRGHRASQAIAQRDVARD